MKLQAESKTFNLGDTSFRRKTLIDDYKILLPFLQQTNLEFPKWNNIAQAEFYKKIIEETDLFSRNSTEDFSKRGRTLTNALVKIGLTNEERKLSEVAVNWLRENTLTADNIEKSLGIDMNNLLFTRQLLKLRVYDSNGINYFSPFCVAIELVKRYQNIPQQDFLALIHLIQPNFSNQKINTIINEYKEVNLNNETFSKYLDRIFLDDSSEVTAEELFSNSPLDREKFDLLFVNRKSSTTQDIYFKFVTQLLQFKSNKTIENLNSLLKLSSENKIKKAFGFGKSVFKKSKNLEDFLNINSDNLLLKDDSQIYNQFILSKKHDIVHEYCDMTKRTFNLSGLFDFNNGLVNSINQEIFSIIFKQMILADEENYSSYEQNLKNPFYQESTLTTILKLNESSILESIRGLLGVEYNSQIESTVANQKEYKFRKFISETFPREKIIELLPLFSIREDDKIQAAVSELASIPTIYEYIIGIAWFYISKENFSITKSLNLTLDGNMRPISHASGGTGDIVIDYDNLTLMLEVTLMNKQAQKRGEWEPVLRHAINLTVDNDPKNVITLFIADELDENTINIWRAVAGVPLKSSNKDKTAELVKIFPLKNIEILNMIKNNCDEQKLFKAINESYSALAKKFDLKWRDKIFNNTKT